MNYYTALNIHTKPITHESGVVPSNSNKSSVERA